MARKAPKVAEELRAAWDRTCRDAVASGGLAELHAARDQYHALLEGHLRFLGEYRAVADLHRRWLGTNPAWTEELSRAERDLRDFYDELFPRWQTADNLRDLLAERFAPPAPCHAVATAHPHA